MNNYFKLYRTLLSIFLGFLAFLYSCNRPGEGSKKAGEHIQNVVLAKVETDPVPEGKNDDSADDPAIYLRRLLGLDGVRAKAGAAGDDEKSKPLVLLTGASS